ncbi:MAG: 2Fe-2S iron-sulfur cluster binding domain-containing protein [Candidatus Cloacimonetes bacterium]|nr:2Fe-2S iron-sulfur cluster binding domain-containing protein [Candidatus Cloacimonadota bacterium]
MKSVLHLNGRTVEVEAPAGRTLLEYLREQELYSVKHGCDHGECGACAVLVDDRPQNACQLLLPLLANRRVETLEHLDASGELTPLRDAFLDHGAAQCGFCTPGMLIVAVALRRQGGSLDEARVREALTGTLCRCTGYVKPVQAILAAEEPE